jgi:hypothetical protein
VFLKAKNLLTAEELGKNKMPNNIFKFVNGKFVMTEGYGSVKKSKHVEEGELQDVADDIKNTEAGLDAQRRGGKPAAAAPTSSAAPAAPAAPGASMAQPQYSEPEADAAQGAAPQRRPSSASLGGTIEDDEEEAPKAEPTAPTAPATEEPKEEEEVDLSNFVGFAKASGLKSREQVEALAQKVASWASSKNIQMDMSKLLTGLDDLGEEPSAAPKQPAYSDDDEDRNPYARNDSRDEELQESKKYINPRRQQKIIRHPSLLPYGYRR